jgi:hypothetical protein
MNQSDNSRVQLCSDGKYRWVYEMNLLTNPTVFLTVFKIFFFIALFIWLVVGLFADLIHGDVQAFLNFGKVMLITLAVFAGLTLLGVLILAAIYGGKYVVLFEMDEERIKHIQLPRQVRKAQVVGVIAAMAGIAAKNPAAIGAGTLAAGKSSSTSEYRKVRRVVPRRALHLIKVNQLFERNQIYVQKEDFDFVYEYIKSRCPQKKA